MKCRYVREQRTICGRDMKTAPFLEVDLFEISSREHRASRRAKQKMATKLAQKKYNEKISIRHFVQIVKTNFTRDAWVLTYTYNSEHLPAPGDEKRVDADWTNCIKRLRRRVQSPIKWVAVPEYSAIDPDTGEVTGRHHHHVILEGAVTYEDLMAAWCDRDGEKIGFVYVEKMDLKHSSAEALARYMVKRRRHARKWRQSRGLQKPKTPQPNDTRYSRRELDRAATLYVDDRAYWEKKYPGFTPTSIEPMMTGAGSWHIVAKLERVPAAQKRRRTNAKNQP